MSLRAMSESDLLMVLAWRNAPVVRKNMYTKHEITEAEHRAWFARIKADNSSKWLMHEDENGIPDGVVYFSQISNKHMSAFWGFYGAIGAKRGVGTLMEVDALEFAFGELDLHKLNCEVIASNESVVKMHKKFGFVPEGLFRGHCFNGCDYEDVVRLGIFRHEWSSQRNVILEKLKRFK